METGIGSIKKHWFGKEYYHFTLLYTRVCGCEGACKFASLQDWKIFFPNWEKIFSQ